ncbi:N-myristoyl transferase [Fomitiporia mediterranea MF3/22]|uniref:N-myristoyl transferase n=1 Tax=Fomitiporia mediterranea (strain MF3/22) TaxID=694068 RepID=UPI0004408372|nr:N-myristoyl transferase [Fomitiporia mediterranea MF3/22]EJD02399.1 N-myristoyl transferase [Fomitiporia mediterranea MF3/22]
MTSDKAKVEEVLDAVQIEDEGPNEVHDSDSDVDDGAPDTVHDGPDTPGAGSSSQSKKKKKKKSKAAKLLNSLRPGQKEIPQSVVDKVMERVREEHGADVAGADEETVRKALEHLKVMDVIQGKAGVAGRGKKDMGTHKFWGTQPVPQPGEGPPIEDGWIEPPVPREQVRQDPFPLPNEFEWITTDLDDPKQSKEVYDLLSLHFVEDDNATFRFQYPVEFLEWALKPPGYHKEWHIGVRVKSNKKLVGFISAVPITIRVRGNTFHASEVNYLCVHKKLRSKRLAPVLIKEVTRQCHLKGIFQAIYTGGVVIPTPVSTCRYFHRTINVSKLVDVGFTFVPRNMTLARMTRLHRLPSTPHLVNAGLREMQEKDIAQVAQLYMRYMERFTMFPIMSLDELRHQFLSGIGTGPAPENWQGRREKQVVWAYVIENPATHKITDFFTFYALPSTIMQSTKYNLLEAAYLFYYATDVVFQDAPVSAEEDGRLKRRLLELVTDALIIASAAGFDVFNALSLMDNYQFLTDLKFGQGDGLLNYYLYNWRTAPLAGMNEAGGVPAGKGVGVVML